MERVKAFFESPLSNLVGIGLGSALIAVNLINFNIFGIVAGVFLILSEGIEYWNRT